MGLRFLSLGSGSRGNATLVASDNALLLVDCGFTLKEVLRRLALLGIAGEDLTALLVTHEHADHIKGIGPLARKFQLPVYMTHGTAQYPGLGLLADLRLINSHQRFAIADIEVSSVTVPHDAREPCQYVFRHAERSLGLLTDLGSITPFVIEQYRHCDALMLECNHDVRMLSMGPYPESLKQRVASQWGHLSNWQAANLLHYIEPSRLQWLLMAHLSEQNNTRVLAEQALLGVLDDPAPLRCAQQEHSSDWFEIV